MNPGDKKIIDNIKGLALDMINEAGSGHPGIVLGAAPIMYTLYANHIRVSLNDPSWINRDRFIMSAGHGSALLYSTLFMLGANFTIEDLKNFRKLNSKTPGHPEVNINSLIEMSTGPLGQGIASAVGFAIAQSYLEKTFNVFGRELKRKNDLDIFNYYTYCLCGDGDLMEGISYEACSLAGTLGLGRLIVLYDSNDVSLDGNTNIAFKENVLGRFEAMGWHTLKVNNGENIEALDKAIMKAKSILNKPSIIEVKTILGKGAKDEGTNKVHGTPLNEGDLRDVKTSLGLRDIPFAVSKEACEEFRRKVTVRTDKYYTEWAKDYNEYLETNKDKSKELLNIFVAKKKESFDILKYRFDFIDETLNEATRDSNGKIMNIIGNHINFFIGGSADVASSTKAYLNDKGDFNRENYTGRNIRFGVREHAMGAILNGIALSGFRSFGSTFLAFSDYLKPAIRLSCLMDLPVTYIFTHDSINIGADGPTHQPVEQLASLRSIPNFNVYRPADSKEVVGCWNEILRNNKPSALILSRTEVPTLKNTDSILSANGAYIVRREEKRINGIILASGSEVHIAVNIALELYKKNIDIRVISVPSLNTFLSQKQKYKDELIPLGYKVIVIEFGSSMGWEAFVYNDKYLITYNDFGKSASKDDLLKEVSLDYESILDKVYKLLT